MWSSTRHSVVIDALVNFHQRIIQGSEEQPADSVDRARPHPATRGHEDYGRRFGWDSWAGRIPIAGRETGLEHYPR